MKRFYLFFSFLLIVGGFTGVYGQATIASDGFENSSSFTITNGSYFTGSSTAASNPGPSPFTAVGTYAYGCNNTTVTMISPIYDTHCYTSVSLSFQLAAFSYNSTSNGLDGSDVVQVFISINGGSTFTKYLEVDGNSNAYWAYSASGTATTAYPSVATFAPTGGGSRTTDGYSLLTITSLPAITNLVVKIVATNNSANELWVIDNFQLKGNTGGCNSITPSTLSSSTYTLDCIAAQSGTIAFTSSGTFNSGNIFTAQLSNSSGSFASPVSIGTLSATGASPSGTIPFTIPLGTATGSGYLIQIVSSNPAVTSGTTSSSISITNMPCAITTGVVSPSGFSLANCTTTATGTVSFTSTGTYTTGNYYTVWMSDETGSFATATNIGSLTSTANTGTIAITIPAGTAAGTGYMVQVSSYTPGVVGSNSSPFTITTACSPPVSVSGMMSNCAALQNYSPLSYGCDANCNETGYTIGPFTSTTVPSNSVTTVLCTGSTSSVTCNGTPNCKTFTQSATFTISPGCTYQAQALFGNRGALCPDGNMDSGDEIHISGSGGTIVSQSAQLVSTSACAATGAAGTHTYATADIPTGCSNSVGTANFVYAAGGSPATITISFSSDRCDEILSYTFTPSSSTCSIIVLPVNFLAFTANRVNNQIIVKWATATEINNDYFMVEYSLDAVNFIPFNQVKGAGNSYETLEYSSLFNEDIGNATPYFRLKQVDFNGNFKYSNIITLGNYFGAPSKPGNLAAYYNADKDKITIKFNLEYPQGVSITLYDVTGSKLIESSQLYNEGNNEILLAAPDKAGMYVLVYQNGNSEPIRKKIMVSK